MDIIELRDTHLSVSRLSFGTARLHHVRSTRDRQKLLATAYDHGFTHFDTSPYYGYGLNEAALGKFISQRGADATVATKIGLYSPLGSARNIAQIYFKKGLGKLLPRLSKPTIDLSLSRAEKSLDQSLRNLRRDVVDVLFLHEPDPRIVDADETLTWLESQRDKGRIRYWGVAGNHAQFSTWLKEGHPLTQVLQVRDQVDAEVDWGKEPSCYPQFTFGYLSAHGRHLSDETVTATLRQALWRNRFGSILVSTRKEERILVLANAARTAKGQNAV